MEKIILDTNAILRHILEDIQEQADFVEITLKNNDVLILPEVMSEVIYVLTKTYNLPKSVAVDAISLFLEDAKCETEVLVNALKIFRNKNFDFVDCLLYEYSKEYKILTFDKKLQRLIGE